MPWEQFELPELDGRLQLIAGYLANKLRGKDIVDLNCGTAPLLDWLHSYNIEWGWYYGNDTNEDSILRCLEKDVWSTTFETVPDDGVIDRLRKNCIDPDILICLGYAARHHSLESATLDKSIVRIATEYKPPIIVLDAWLSIIYAKRCKFSCLLENLTELGYKIAYNWEISAVDATSSYSRRRVVILEAA